MSKLILKVRLKFDDIEAEKGDFSFTTNGEHNLMVTIEDKKWLDEYEKGNEVEQSLILQEIMDDYISTYTKFMMELYDFDEEYVQDKVSVAIDEEFVGDDE